MALDFPDSPVDGQIYPTTPTQTGGQFIYNNTVGVWQLLGKAFNFPAMGASGGTEATSGGYKYHTFTASGSLTVSTGGYCDVLIIAGGGGQGSSSRGGTGGGAGGLVLGYNAVIPAGSYTVTVGAGGASQSAGGDSSIFSATADGGGPGTSGITGDADGGSGGGGGGNREGFHGVSTQTDQTFGGITAKGYGNRGGDTDQGGSWYQNQAGGGGAGSASEFGVASAGVSTGGSGLVLTEWADATSTGHFGVYASGGSGGGEANTISGAPIGGGGVGGVRNAVDGTNGIVNTGGGGGGHAYYTGTANNTGGSGLIIVRYAI